MTCRGGNTFFFCGNDVFRNIGLGTFKKRSKRIKKHKEPPCNGPHKLCVTPNLQHHFYNIFPNFQFAVLARPGAPMLSSGTMRGQPRAPSLLPPGPQFKSQSRTIEGFQRERGGSRLVPDHQNSIDFQSILKESGTWPGKVNQWSRLPLLYENLGLDLFDLQGG